MATNKVEGTSSSDPDKDPARLQEHRKIEKVEKVKSIDEVENERSRKQRFRQFMEGDEDPPAKKSPSPLESGFYKSTSSPLTPPRPSMSETLGNIPSEIVPDPAHSVPPNVQWTSPQPMEGSQNTGNSSLPRGPEFWNSTDNSSKPQSPGNYQEVSSTQSHKHKKQVSDIVPNQLPDISQENKKDKLSSKDPLKVGKTTKAAKSQKEKPVEATQAPHLEETKKQTSHLASQKETPAPITAPFHFQDKESYDPESDSGGKKRRQEMGSIEITAPSTTPMPAHIETIAQVATLQSMSYVSPQIAPLFFQMVGQIHMMTGAPSGVSRTEVILNSPSFANSRFFGSKILIERYSTAPDAFNIRLTGTNEAVHAFQQNITGLYAAFQNGNFPFRIGRISAEYSVEKPLFRRKDEKGRAGSDGEDFTDTRGSK